MSKLYRSYVVAVLCLACSSPTEGNLEARCRPIVEDILKTQEYREILRKDFSITREGYTAGTISYAAFNSEYHRWLQEESTLSLRVNDLYTAAYAEKCL